MKLVLFSGGVDSSTCLALAKTKDKDVTCISFDYGQRHGRYELAAAKKVADYYQVPLKTIDLKSIFAGGSSSITDLSKDVSIGDYSSQKNFNTEVEFRNGVFISILTSLAMQMGADEIYFGAHQDETGNIYPDCSPGFVTFMNKAIQIGTNNRVTLKVPFLHFTKTEVVRFGKALDVPYDLTYSCYNGTMPPCGKCGTCLDRIKAFRANGIEFD